MLNKGGEVLARSVRAKEIFKSAVGNWVLDRSPGYGAWPFLAQFIAESGPGPVIDRRAPVLDPARSCI